MPDYKRLISYIYNYEDGMKKNNVGYARVEARNGQCKCTLHIAAPSLNDRQLQVYIFKRKEGFEGILLGTLVVKNGNGDYKAVTDSMHIMNSAYGLDDMSGILLYLSDRKFFASSWDDAPITLDMVADLNGSKSESRLRAAGRVNGKAESTVNREESPAETVKDNIIKVNFKEGVKNVGQKETQSILESEEYLEQNEGEVYNDRNKNGKETIVGSNQKPQQILPVEFNNKGDISSGSPINSNNKEEQVNTDYIKDNAAFKEEAKTPSEIQDEDLYRLDNIWSKKFESNQGAEETAEAAGFGFADQDYDYMSLLNEYTEGSTSYAGGLEYADSSQGNGESGGAGFYRSEELFNNSGLQPENIDSQFEVNSENCQEEPVKQAFFEDHPVAKKIYQSYPRMYPFEDNEVAWCVKIEPQDIGLFPMEAWILGNNSFLLHGYYSYRHLIFARINDKNGISYILGVPGIYHNREKFMAKMFGFENFKCAKRKAQRTGEFGYWYIPITLS